MAVETLRAAETTSVSPWADAFRRLRRNPIAVISGTIILILIFVAIFAPVIAPYKYDVMDHSYSSLPALADHKHKLGTDNLGYDVLSRLMYGSRVSLAVGLIVQLIEVTIG